MMNKKLFTALIMGVTVALAGCGNKVMDKEPEDTDINISS